MGNKASSSLTVVFEALSTGKIALNNARGDETLQQLDDILESAQDISLNSEYSKSLSGKDAKLLSSIATLLAQEFGKTPDNNSSPAVVRACKLKAVAAIHRLVGLQVIAKTAMEACVPGLVNCLDKHSTESALLALTLNCIYSGVLVIDDDTYRSGVCVQLEKSGFYEKILDILTFLVENKEQSGLYYPTVVITEHLIWLLGVNVSSQTAGLVSLNFKTLQARILSLLVKKLDNIFELFRIPEKPIRMSMMMLLVQLFNVHEKKICINIQVISLVSISFTIVLFRICQDFKYIYLNSCLT